VSEHRLKTNFPLEPIINGQLDLLIDQLVMADQRVKLEKLAETTGV
jgi:protein subunit release factor A